MSKPHKSDKPLVSLSYRKPEFARPKPDNITKITALAEQGAIQLLLGSQPKSIDEVIGDHWPKRPR